MARASSGATFSLLLPPAIPSPTLRRFRLTLRLAPSVSAQFSSKRTKRKNHLRPKILKTLTKPFRTAPLLDVVPLEITLPNSVPLPPENDAVFDEIPCESESLPSEEADKFEEFRVSETISKAGERSGVVSRISATSVLKFCGFLVGAFLFQTICAVWFVENTDSSTNEKRLINLDGKGSIFLNGSNVDYFDETEMQEKISQIRAMAREARERERTERNQNNEENDIEREIGARLAKLEKRMSSQKEKFPRSFMNYLGLFEDEDEEDEVVEDKSLELKEDQKNLMFKKKLRFRNPSINSMTSPKGFSGSSSMSGGDPNGKTSDSETIKMDNGKEVMNRQFNSSEIYENNLGKEEVDIQNEMKSGAAIKSSQSKTSTKESRKASTKSNGLASSQKVSRKSNGLASSSRKRGKDLGRPTAKAGNKQSAAQADLWWLKLPYVLAILMRRGSEQDGSAGLYALKTFSGQGESSYTIAFEDRGDANNFCYLLESFFEDLGDFSADIVPLSTKEIHEAVKSGSKKVIIVKKGQLKLYAGQPFAEVEMALQSLLGQD